MISDINKFWGWVSAGSLSVCLAFILFIPSLEYGKWSCEVLSLRLFISAVPFLVASILFYRAMLKEEGAEGAYKPAHVVASIGSFLTLSAFLCFIASLGWIELISLIGGTACTLYILNKYK